MAASGAGSSGPQANPMAQELEGLPERDKEEMMGMIDNMQTRDRCGGGRRGTERACPLSDGKRGEGVVWLMSIDAFVLGSFRVE